MTLMGISENVDRMLEAMLNLASKQKDKAKNGVQAATDLIVAQEVSGENSSTFSVELTRAEYQILGMGLINLATDYTTPDSMDKLRINGQILKSIREQLEAQGGWGER